MASHDQQLGTPRYSDWFKACIALKYLKGGIEEFVDDETKEQQKNILQEVQKEIGQPGVTCNSCPIDQLRAFNQGSYKKSNRCTKDVCNRFFDKIEKQHMYGKPSWSNTDSTKWCENHWEIAKCFLDGGGYRDIVSASDTDCKGLLSVITNNMFVQRNVDTPIDKNGHKEDVFSKSKEARNKILHHASFQLPVEKLNKYVDVMIQLLEDKGKLHEHDNAKKAISKLRQLTEPELHISSTDEREIRKAALKAIQERKQEALDEIEKKQDEILEKIQIDKFQDTLNKLSKTSKETSLSFSNRIESLEQRQNVLESTLIQMQKCQEEDVATMKKDLSELKARFDAFDKIELQHKKSVAYLDHKNVVRKELSKMYSKYLSNIPVPPLLQKLDATVEEFYMELEICDDLVYEKRSNEKKKKKRSLISNLSEIFYKEEKRVENIYVLGDAGVGKTTWCLKLIHTWLQGLKKQKKEGSHSLSPNEKMMLEFDFVLFVSLRHASKDLNLIDMIQNQIFYSKPQHLEHVQEALDTEPDRCLVIADGLDEWNAPDNQISSPLGNDSSFPSRKNMNHCTVISTTRPWKLNEARPSYSLIDRAVLIRGLSGDDCVRKLAEKVIHKLNQNVSHETSQEKNEKKVENFEQELYMRFPCCKFGDRVTQIPLILIIMVVKWFNDDSLESTMAGNYSFMLKSMLEHEEGYGREKKLDGRFSRKSKKNQAKRERSTDAKKLPGCVRKHDVCSQYSWLILKLAEIAFDGLFERNDKALIFSKESFLEKLSPEEEAVALNSGILSKSDIVGHCDVSKLSFLHKTVQEFMAAIYLVVHHEDGSSGSYKKFKEYCSTYDRIYEMENVILFISGLDANLTVKLVSHFTKVDIFMQQYRVYFSYLDHKRTVFDLVFKCIKELREFSSNAFMPMVPLNAFIPKDMQRFDELTGLLESSVDKESIRYIKVKMSDQQEMGHNRLIETFSSFYKQGLGPKRLLDILSSELSPLLSLTTLTLEHISGISLHTRTNKRVVFTLHNLRNLKLCYINTNNISKEVVFEFAHSKDIESVHLDSIFSCHFGFSGTNLKDIKLEQLKHCHVSINDGVAVQAVEKTQSIGDDNKNQCTYQTIDCMRIKNCSVSKLDITFAGGEKNPYGMEARIVSLTLQKNRFCKVNIDPNIRVDSVVLIRKDVIPNIAWKDVQKVVLKGVINKKTRQFYIDVLDRIGCSQNLTSLQCIGCNHFVISKLMETVESAKKLKSLKIINGIETLDIDKLSFNALQIKDLVLKGSCIKILENENEEISKFSSLETLKLSNLEPLSKVVFYSSFQLYDEVKMEANAVVELLHKGMGSLRSLVNLKCLKCEGFTERDFIMLGKCFQYLSNLEELELSYFWWNKVENPYAFSCMEQLEKLKKLSLRELVQTVISSISVYVPNLSLSEIVLERCLDIIQSLNNMKTLKKLTFTKSSHSEFEEFINLIQNFKQIESLIILKPVKYLDGHSSQLEHVLGTIDLSEGTIDLSEFVNLENFLLEDVHIYPRIWQTFESCLPKNGRLETLEFRKAVIEYSETEQMIKSTPGFVCQKWDYVGPYTDIILKAK